MRVVFAVLLVACSSSTSDPPTTEPADTSVTVDSAVPPADTSATDSAIADTASPPLDTATTEETPAADTWESWAKGFFAKYCVECHGATSATRRYTVLDDVKRDSVKIKCGTASVKLAGCGSFPPPKQFPIDNTTKTNPKPSDAERARLVAWIEAGTP
jgi:hypothetical protein